MEELQVNMLGSPHSNGLAALLSKMAFLCASMLVLGRKRGVWWVLPTVGAPLCTLQTPNTEQQSHWWRGVAATSGAASLPPASIPPSGVSGQHKQTTSWAGRSQFGFHLGGKE